MKNVNYGSPDIYEQNSVILFPLLILAKNNSKVPITAKKQPKIPDFVQKLAKMPKLVEKSLDNPVSKNVTLAT